MSVGPAHYAALSAVLFAIGLFGVTTRRNVVAALASLSVLFSAPVIAAVGFAESRRRLAAAPRRRARAVHARRALR